MTGRSASVVSLDLDALERDGDVPEPFTVRVGKREYTLRDPKSCSFDDLVLVVQSPARFIVATAPEADREALWTAVAALPAWKVDALAASYMAHHGMPSPPESDASPTR